MNTFDPRLSLSLLLSIAFTSALAGPLDPDCTAEKAAKSAATKATLGVGGRCSPAEAAKDTAKDMTGLGDDKAGLLNKDDDKKDQHKDKNKDKDKDKDRDKDKNKAWSSG